MNKSPLLVVMAILVVVLGGVSIAQLRSAQSLRRALGAVSAEAAVARAKAEQDRAELERLNARIALFQQESEALRKQLAGGGAAPGESAGEATASAADSNAGGGKPGPGNFMKGMAKMMQDPDMKKMIRSQQAMGVRMMYGDLAKELGLSPDEATQVMELLTERQLGMAAKGMELMGGEAADEAKLAEAGEAAKASREEFDQQLRGVLGEERMKKLENYERTLGDRMALQQYQQSLAASGTPITDQQRDGLLEIMADERLKTPPNPLEANNKDMAAQIKAMQSGEGLDQFVQSTQDFNQRVLTRVRSILNPDQVNAFESAQKQQLEMLQFGMKMGREMMKGEGAGNPPQPVEVQQ